MDSGAGRLVRDLAKTVERVLALFRKEYKQSDYTLAN